MGNKLINIKNILKSSILKNKFPLLITITVWAVVVFVTLSIYSSTLGMKSIGENYHSDVYEINEDTEIMQIIPVIDDARSISTMFATYSRKNKGSVNINITGLESGTVYADKTINVSNIQDNSFLSIKLDEPTETKNDKNIVIKITSTSKQGKGVGVYYSDILTINNSKLSINEKEYDGNLTTKYMIPDATLHNFYKKVIIWSISIITIVIFAIILFDKVKYEYVFAVLAFTLGLIFMAIITPHSAPDEILHYQYSAQLSNKIMGQEDYLKYDRGAYIGWDEFEVQINDVEGYYRLEKKLNGNLETLGDVEAFDVDINEVYNVYYIPQALGITIGRLLKVNALKTFYAGRFINLLFYVFCVFVAIKKTSIQKLLFGIISILPIFIQQAASYSYDCFVNGLCLILIAYFMKWRFEDKTINDIDYIFVFIVCLAIAPAKYVYGPLVFLFWFVPTSRFKNKTTKILLTTLLCVPTFYKLFPIIYTRIVWIVKHIIESIKNGTTAKISKSSKSVNAVGNITSQSKSSGVSEPELYSINYAFRHITETIRIIYNTIRNGLKTWLYGSVGRYLSGLTIILPLRLSQSLLLTVFVSSLVKQDHLLPISNKVWILVVCIIVGLLTLAGMLLSWTHVGDTTIQGMQGRYFCPLIPYVSSTLNNAKINISKKCNKYILFAYLIMLFEVIVYVLSYTFVN